MVGWVHQTGFVNASTETGSGSPVSSTEASDMGEGFYVLDIDENNNVGWRKTSPSGEISLGITSSEAFPGDKGQEALDHAQAVSGNPHNVSIGDLNAANVGGDENVGFRVKRAEVNSEAVNLEQMQEAISNVSCEAIDCGDFS